MFPAKIQYIISNYLILGFIPLDKTLHFIVGMGLTILMRFRGYRFSIVFLVLGLLEFAKELIDYGTLQHKVWDSFLDAVATFAYPVLLVGVIHLRKKI